VKPARSVALGALAIATIAGSVGPGMAAELVPHEPRSDLFKVETPRSRPARRTYTKSGEGRRRWNNRRAAKAARAMRRRQRRMAGK
jgi:hypothetical protein